MRRGVLATRRVESIYATLKIVPQMNKFKVIMVYDDKPVSWGIKEMIPTLGSAENTMNEYADKFEANAARKGYEHD